MINGICKYANLSHYILKVYEYKLYTTLFYYICEQVISCKLKLYYILTITLIDLYFSYIIIFIQIKHSMQIFFLCVLIQQVFN